MKIYSFKFLEDFVVMGSETIKGGSENIARKIISTTCRFFNNGCFDFRTPASIPENPIYKVSTFSKRRLLCLSQILEKLGLYEQICVKMLFTS
jgi:hypothetical protein